MNIFAIFIIYGWVFPFVLLGLHLSRRPIKAGDSPKDLKRGGFENGVYEGCKLLTVIWLILWGMCYLPAAWPPHWLERMQQRKIVLERVQQAGGWDVIKRDCNELVQSNVMTGFQWYRDSREKGFLPKSLETLKPYRVDLWPEADGMQSIRIQIFGAHSTGGRGTDFYILKVVCPLPSNVQPPFKGDSKAKVRYGNQKIVDGVYEVTRNG